MMDTTATTTWAAVVVIWAALFSMGGCHGSMRVHTSEELPQDDDDDTGVSGDDDTSVGDDDDSVSPYAGDYEGQLVYGCSTGSLASPCCTGFAEGGVTTEGEMTLEGGCAVGGMPFRFDFAGRIDAAGHVEGTASMGDGVRSTATTGSMDGERLLLVWGYDIIEGAPEEVMFAVERVGD